MRRDATFDRFLGSDKPLSYLVEQSQTIRAFQELRPVSRLISNAQANADAGSSGGIDDAICDFLETESSWFENYFLEHIRNTSRDANVLPPFGEAIEPELAIFHNVTVYSDANLNITITAVDGKDLEKGRDDSALQQVLFSGQRIFYKFWKCRDLNVEIWNCDPFDDTTDLRATRLSGKKRITVRPDDILDIDGGRQSLSFVGCGDKALFIQVENRRRNLGFSVAFNVQNGSFLVAHPTCRNAMRKMVMCSTLRNLGRSAEISEVDASNINGPFYERWHFLREVTAAAPERGIQQMREALSKEANPSVRRAASQTIAILEGMGVPNAG